MDKKRIRGVIAFIGVAMAIFIFSIYQSNKKYIDFVKHESPRNHPGITYEKAFNNYFGDCKWSYFVSEDEEDIVEFNGTCSLGERPANIRIQFLLNYNAKKFEICAVAIDDISLDRWEIPEVIERVFKDY